MMFLKARVLSFHNRREFFVLAELLYDSKTETMAAKTGALLSPFSETGHIFDDPPDCY